jgi:hypothetical protein
MTIEEVLVKQYGPILSLAELAMILDRSPDGLRASLRSSASGLPELMPLGCDSVVGSIFVRQR